MAEENHKVDNTTNMMYSKVRKYKMNRTFKEVPIFTKKWQSLGLTDEDLRAVE